MMAAATTSNAEVTLAVLAGGRGARMGTPKSGLVIGSKPILSFLLDRFAWAGPRLLVTSPGNERPIGWDQFDAEATDPQPDQGPLRGILTALEHCATAMVAVVTVDMPEVTKQQVDWLVGELSEDGLAVMCSRNIENVARVEPFPCVLRTGAKEMIARRLRAGSRSVFSLGEEPGVKIVPAPAAWEPRTWTNLNRPEDLRAYQPE